MPFKHEAVEIKRRQAGPPLLPPAGVSALATPSTSSIITLITPSPGASLIAVTSQSQIVTSYVPQFTLCELPPIGFFSVPIPSVKPSTAPYHNYSVSIPPGNGTCTTIYSATETMVCDTTLSGLVTTYPVTNCAQDITFSSQYGYTIVTPTPTASLVAIYPLTGLSGTANESYSTGVHPSATATMTMITPTPFIMNQTTYYLAPWHELLAATAPPDVVKQICMTWPNSTEECITQYQVWHTSLVTATATSTLSLNISTIISGPSQVIVWETFVANVTEIVTTFSMMTTMETEYQTAWTTTHRTTASVSTAPTVYQTLTVEMASSTPGPSATSTTTRRITSTIYMGTTTVPAPADFTLGS